MADGRKTIDLLTVDTSDLLIMLTNERVLVRVLFGADNEWMPNDPVKASRLVADTHAKIIAEVNRRFPVPK